MLAEHGVRGGARKQGFERMESKMDQVREKKFGSSKRLEHFITSEGKIRSYKKGTGELKREYCGLFNRKSEKQVFTWGSEAAGKEITVRVERLVAEAFIPNPLGLKWIKHKNGVLSDDRVENLEWSSSHDMRSDYWDTI